MAKETERDPDTPPGLKTMRVFSRQRAHVGAVPALQRAPPPEGASATFELLQQEASALLCA